MTHLTAAQIRQTFISFFESKGHKHLPSSSLVPYNDPTVMLTTAGMLQFKPIMFGTEQPTHRRVTTYQKCFRTTDLENVGFTPRHHTFFEMLGNFSFGDYYKEEAITWAWELMTEKFGLPPEKLYITIFRTDEEAYQIWHDKIGIAPDHIVRRDEDTNFWAAGDTGPCGPCSEIYYDLGPEFDNPIPAQAGDECDRYLEFYNLVFMAFNRQPDGSLLPLPAKNIDTGMGLERMASILQGKTNNYDTDLMQAIIGHVRQLVPAEGTQHEKYNVALQVIADHSRASVQLIADGVLPDNEGRGYVLRRVLRRAIRFGHLIGIESPFLNKLIPTIVAQYPMFPEVAAKQAQIHEAILAEEDRFSKTLQRGMKKLEEALVTLRAQKSTVIPGEVVFELYDTYGFPAELTEEIAQEQKLTVDMAGYQAEMAKQVERARAAARSNLDLGAGVVDFPPTVFTGYDTTHSASKVLALLETNQPNMRRLILAQTPFYAESGGQVSDQGQIQADGHTFEVLDVQKVGDIFVHVIEGAAWEQLQPGQEVQAFVDNPVRQETMKHHSVTHLMHKALKQVLGDQIKQAGSEVTHDHTRFDFSCNRALSTEEVQQVEALVNEQVMANLAVQTDVLPLEQARESGAVAMFGEKYGETVRVVSMGVFSKEFCGGTHVPATGVIGSFKIVSEEAIAAGTRRITAVAGKTAYHYARDNEAVLKGLAAELRVPLADVAERFRKLQETLRTQEKELKQLKQKLAMQQVHALTERFQQQGEISWVAAKIEVPDLDSLKQVAEAVGKSREQSVVILACSLDGKVNVVAAVSESVVKQGLQAGQLIKTLAPIVGARGGGKPQFAQAGGGTEVDKLGELLQQVPALLGANR